MLEELKIIVTLFEGVANAAMWAAGGFFVFKLIVYLSIIWAIFFGVRFIVAKIDTMYKYNQCERPIIEKKIVEEVVQVTEIVECDTRTLKSFCISQDKVHAGVIKALKKAREGTGDTALEYFHKSHLVWLNAAIDEKIERESKDETSS